MNRTPTLTAATQATCLDDLIFTLNQTGCVLARCDVLYNNVAVQRTERGLHFLDKARDYGRLPEVLHELRAALLTKR